MSLKALSDYTITSKYAKYLPEQKRRETWDEIVDRSLNMHLKKFKDLPTEDLTEIKESFQLVKEKKVLPSMRSMQFGGEAIERKNARLFNCCALHIHDTRCIEKAFYLLLCGVGCGFGLGKKWVAKFPKLVKEKFGTYEYQIEDSIEGWASSTKLLIDSYLEGNVYSGNKIQFDYSQIRPKGAPLSHGGKAPGPDGLRFAHLQIEKLLDNVKGNTLSTLNVYDIMMHVSDAVLSGGIRRAATIVLFDKDDDLLLNAKTGNWFAENPQRARSNNTVLLERKGTSLAEFIHVVERTKEFGEPGFAFVDDLDVLTNPCAEINFLPFYNGKPAVQMCNLTTVNGNKITTEDEFRTYVKAATIIGTLQATYTDFEFLDDEDKKMTEEEALLGVSILGSLANPQILVDENVLAEMAQYAVSVNEDWAKKLNVNPAARVTCQKPDGNSSCVLESPFSGIHPAHAQKYYRRVQVNKTDPIYQYFKEVNPHLCEESVYSATKTDDVISFPIRLTNSNGIVKSNLNALEHLDIIKKVQNSWVKNGEKNNKKPISHNISCTVLVNDDEWDEVIAYLYLHRDAFTAVSLLARTGDKLFAQAPYEAIQTADEHHEWNSKYQSTKAVDYSLMVEHHDNTSRNQELACVGGVCTL